MLPIDLAEISNEEGIFITRLAGIMINIVDPILQSIANQMFGIIQSIIFAMIALDVRILGIIKII